MEGARLPQQSGADPSRESRWFLLACLGVAASLAGLCVWLASQEYFFGDDFVFLAQAQRPRRWLSIFLPFRGRGWWSYRPLSIEVYFSTFYGLAGLRAFPYLLASLALHFATGLLVHRIARQLDLERRVAIAMGVLSVAMYPSLFREVFWASTFQTVCGRFFYLATISFFLEFLRGRGRASQLGACASMVLTLLSNELGITLPGPLVLLAWQAGGGGLTDRLRGALRRTAPELAIFSVYLLLRYGLFGPSYLKTPALYEPRLGWHVVHNVWTFLQVLTKQSPAALWAVLAIAAGGWLCAATRRDGAVDLLASRALVLGGWLLAAMVPFAAAYGAHHRAAIIMEAPFCLLLGAHLDPIVRACRTTRARRLAEAGLVALLLVLFPYAALRAQATAPRGAVNRDLLEIVRSVSPPADTCVRLEPRADEAWTDGELYALRFRTTGLFEVAFPDLQLETPPLQKEPPQAKKRRPCSGTLRVELRHGPPGSDIPHFRLRLPDPGPA